MSVQIKSNQGGAKIEIESTMKIVFQKNSLESGRLFRIKANAIEVLARNRDLFFPDQP